MARRDTDESLPLFPPARRNAPATSHAAAKSAAARSLTDASRIMVELIGRRGYGATDEELGHALALRLQTVSPRRGELVKRGQVRASGRTRPTTSGRKATVWVVATAAHLEAEPRHGAEVRP